MDDNQRLIPRDKFDLITARAAAAAGYPTVAPILPELLEWLQDCNWPVSGVLAPFLASIGEPLVPHVRRVLESGDEVWKYWMICAIMKQSPIIAAEFRDTLERLAYAPTEREVTEELNEVARDVLEQYGWGD
jgi:hypothetical protein